jgi:hypothetical protein
MSDKALEIPFGLLKVLETILLFPAANILKDIASANRLHAREVESEGLDYVDRLQTGLRLIVIGVIDEILRTRKLDRLYAILDVVALSCCLGDKFVYVIHVLPPQNSIQNISFTVRAIIIAIMHDAITTANACPSL